MHLMIDLETLSTLPNAPILQIGLVAFEPDGRGYSTCLRWDVDPQSCLELGLCPEWSTIAFWMQQAREQTTASERIMYGDHTHLADALQELADVVAQLQTSCVWSHGAGFDLPILRSAYAAIGLRETPWSYRDERCTRTLFALADEICPGWRQNPLVEGLVGSHDALADARVQALRVQAAWGALSL